MPGLLPPASSVSVLLPERIVPPHGGIYPLGRGALCAPFQSRVRSRSLCLRVWLPCSFGAAALTARTLP